MAYSAFENAFVAILFTKLTRWGGKRARRGVGAMERGPRWAASYNGARTEVELGVKAPATANRYATTSLFAISTSSISSLAIIRLRLFKPITYR